MYAESKHYFIKYLSFSKKEIFKRHHAFKRNGSKCLYIPLHAYPRCTPRDIGAVRIYTGFEFMFAFYAVRESRIREREREREMHKFIAR